MAYRRYANTPSGLRIMRRSLHGVAELLMAGPQYRRSGTIRLRIVPGGFATVAEPDVMLRGSRLFLAGKVAADLEPDGSGPLWRFIDLVGLRIDIGAPQGVYQDGSGLLPTDGIYLPSSSTAKLLENFEIGDVALREFAPDQTPVLWPEHFDVAITMNEVNYGVSLGDDFLDEPYAYVGPRTPQTGVFWNAPFGAARPMTGLSAAAVREFFEQGRRLIG
jgi:hypothetical protein